MIREGTEVKWKWGNGTAAGKLESTHTEKFTLTSKGTEVSRIGKEGDKALVIIQEDGVKVLKLESEVERDS